MFSRRSPRRRRSSALGSFIERTRSRWSHANVDRVFGLKRGYSRRLSLEPLEDRRLLTVNVYFDNVNNQISIVDDYADDILQTGGESFFNGANNVQEDNDVTLSNGVSTPGRLRITDPLGVILEPGVSGTQISDTVVEVDSTSIVRVDLQGGNDRLIFASDFNAVATLVTLNAHGGDPSEGDGLIMNATSGVAETVTVTVDNSDQDEQDITGYAGKVLNVRGYESILYDGSGSNDNLIVDLGQGEAIARVQNSSTADTDEVVSSTLPTVLFNGISNFTLQGDSGESTTATFVIDSLGGASTFTFASQDSDTLVIEGNGGADSVTASLVGGNLRVAANGNTIDTTGMSSGDLLLVDLLGGNDSLLVNINGTTPIATPIEFDGGSGSDILLIQGTPAPAIVDVVYTPRSQPDEGRLEYRGAAGARLMSIDFDDLEPVVDLVVAPTLIINGTPASNSITYAVGPNSGVVNAANPAGAVTGLATIDNSESIEFANKTAVVINGLAGDDVIVADNGTIPAALNNITFNGDFGNDTIRVENLPAAGGTFATATVNGGDGDDIIDASLNTNTTPLTLNGGAGDDTITGGLGADTITGGAGNDTIFVSSGTDNVDGGNATGGDTLKVAGNAAANTVTVQATAANVLAFSGNLVAGATTIAGLENFRIELGDSNDQLTIDLPNPILITAFPLFYDGGTGADTFTVQGNFGGAATIDSVVYTPGLQVDEGRLLYTDGAQIMDVTFDNIEPVIDTAAAAQLIVNGNGAANAVTVSAPQGAALATVSVDGFETITFNNKANLTVNALGGDDIVNVNIAATAVVLALSTLTLNGNDGNDTVRFQNLPTAAGFTGATVNAGAGNDTIDAFNIPTTTVKPLTLNGEEGNDTITGGPNGDTISGGLGNDVIIASPGNDNIDGVSGDDQLQIIGRILPDTIAANQSAAGALVVTYNGNARTYTVANLDLVQIDGGLGDDVIAVNVVDTVLPANSLPFNVIGNSPNASDRLIVNDDGAGDLVIHRQGPDGRSGSVVLGSTQRIANVNSIIEPPKMRVTYESIERVDVVPIDTLGRTGTGAGGQLVVFHYDDFEANDAEVNATPIGPKPIFLGLRNIDPGPLTGLPAPFPVVPGDSDWYEFRPDKTGTFRFEVLFEQIDTVPDGRPGLPDDGNLKIEVYRADGTLLGTSDQSVNTAINIKTREFFDFSAAEDTPYYLRVLSSNNAALGTSGAAINNYQLFVSEVDDDGPQVFDPNGPTVAIFPNNLTTYDLFALKPNVLGPSPLIYSLTINVRDLPVRAPGDLYAALLEAADEAPGLYHLVGDHVGHIAIQSVDVINEPQSNYQFNSNVTSAGNTTTTFTAAGLVALNDTPQEPLVGDTIQFITGPAAGPGNTPGEIRTITAYNRNTGQITVGVPFLAAPNAGDTFTLRSFAEAKIVLTFAKPLPDDRFTLTLLDGIVDPAENALDGESNADEPRNPTFPSGNGIAGGDFVARFTVDSRPEIGSNVSADIDIDINGNFVWDPSNAQIGNDATNVDLSFTLLVQSGINGPLTPGGYNVNDLLFAGKFTNGGVLPPRLFDQLAAFGYSAELGAYRWLIDTTGDGVITTGTTDVLLTLAGGASPTVLGVSVAGAIPIAGNFDNNAANGDEIGLYIGGKWLLDTNHDFVLNQLITGNMNGAPVVGDFDGNGTDDFAVFNNNQFFFDMSRDGNTDAALTVTWGFPGVLDKPIAADMDGDGIDDIGLWEPRNSASVPREVSEWYILVSGSPQAPLTSVTSQSVITASNFIGNTQIAPGQLVRVRSGATGVVTYGTVQAFNSATGQITLTGNLGALPAVGDLVSVGGVVNTITKLNHAFNTAPFGNDIMAEFGDELALPIIGNFDPPAAPTIIAASTTTVGDYDGNGLVNNADINAWRSGFGSSTNMSADGNHDGKVDAADYVLLRKIIALAGSGTGATQTDGSALVGAGAAVVEATAPIDSSVASGSGYSVAAAGASGDGEATAVANSSQAPIASSVPTPVANPDVLDGLFDNLASDSDVSPTTLWSFATTSGSTDENLLLAAAPHAHATYVSSPFGPAFEDEPVDNEVVDSALDDLGVELLLELSL